MIGDHNNPHLTDAGPRSDRSVAGDGALVLVAFLISAGLVVGLITALVVWGLR